MATKKKRTPRIRLTKAQKAEIARVARMLDTGEAITYGSFEITKTRKKRKLRKNPDNSWLFFGLLLAGAWLLRGKPKT